MVFRYLFSFWFLFGSIWALVGTPFLVIGLGPWLAEWPTRLSGVNLEAVVTRGGSEASHVRSGGEILHDSVVTVQFRDSNGRPTARPLKASPWRTLDEGARVRIVHDETSGRVVFADPFESLSVDSIFFGLIGMAFGGTGWVLVAWQVRRALRSVTLLRSGLPVQGVVKDVKPDLKIRINGRHPLVLIYAFRGPDGVEREGASIHLPHALESRWKTGDAILVVCDPAAPSRHEPDLFGARLA